MSLEAATVDARGGADHRGKRSRGVALARRSPFAVEVERADHLGGADRRDGDRTGISVAAVAHDRLDVVADVLVEPHVARAIDSPRVFVDRLEWIRASTDGGRG